MKRIALFTFIFCIFILIRGETMELKNGEEQLLRLIICADKEGYDVGEILKLSYTIQNLTKRDIIFVEWNYGCAATWIKMYDRNGYEMSWEMLCWPWLELSRDVYVTIPKEDKYTINIEGEFKKGKNNEILVDFHDSVIILKGEGEYSIKGVYEISEHFKKEGEKKYGLNNIWIGKLESNEIKIRIKKLSGDMETAPSEMELDLESRRRLWKERGYPSGTENSNSR